MSLYQELTFALISLLHEILSNFSKRCGYFVVLKVSINCLEDKIKSPVERDAYNNEITL